MAVELQDIFLWPYGNRYIREVLRYFSPPSPAPPDRSYDYGLLLRVRQAVRAGGVRVAAWDCDTNLADSATFSRDAAYLRLALRTGRQLGAPILRITVEHEQMGDAIGPVVDLLRQLLQDAEREGVRLALENHGRTTGPQPVIDIVAGCASPWLGVCLDFGNLRPESADRDFEALAPHAIFAHAKSYAFDGAGEETTIPYMHRIVALRAAGYDGVISVEYEGDGNAEDGIRHTRALIERCWASL